MCERASVLTSIRRVCAAIVTRMRGELSVYLLMFVLLWLLLLLLLRLLARSLVPGYILMMTECTNTHTAHTLTHTRTLSNSNLAPIRRTNNGHE